MPPTTPTAPADPDEPAQDGHPPPGLPARHPPAGAGAAWGLYGSVARGSFRRYATYRAATLAGLFTNTVFGFILAYTFAALWQARPGLGGYDTSQAVTYIWVSQGLLVTVAVWGGGFQDDVQTRIRDGDIVVDLYRPVDFQLWWLASDLGRAAFHLLARGIVPLAVGALAFHLRMPVSASTWVAFLLSVALAVVVSFGIRYLVSLAGFWLLDSEGLRTVALLLGMFFSGMLLPIALFPGALGEVARIMPWSAMIQIPGDVFLERRTGGDLAAAFGFQAAWALVLLAAGRAVQGLATRKVVVQGG
ncbi:ABC transporter permease [Allostreptomyces psammosilenae]|uniref:ABC-2 type transport system permease protein n=1 Tax=Allostreptomyces psammosilenae TaxID=1892865 RepID=A0A852ZU39_9ACTN|nr:ABC-2 family transporter protein [Allostreptomyces psammosilenae]NYI04284.1 ABC-2 type transport system permease protein [Allostreptomyces psammosilenae]